jgi:PAS domain S-box-containing protein
VGSIFGWCNIATDIGSIDTARTSELLQAEAKPFLAEDDRLKFINALPTAAWSTRPDGYCNFVSERWLEFTGLTFEQAEGWGWISVVHPGDIQRLLEHWRAHLHSGWAADIEARVRGSDGHYRWFLFRTNPVRDGVGNIIVWYGANIDIEDRKRAEEALVESERQARLIVDRIPALVVVMGPNGETEYLNAQFLDYVGLPRAEAMNWETNETVHPDDLAGSMELFAKSLQTGQPYSFENRLRGADGVYRWFQVRGLQLADADGRVRRWYGVITDVDNRRRAEENLRESERQLQLIVSTIPGLVVVFGPDGQLESANQQMLDYVGQTLNEFKDWATNGSVHPDDLATGAAKFTNSLISGDPYEFEVRVRRHDGVYRWFQVRGNPARDADGNIIRWYGLLIDIDDRKQAEVALADSERESRLIVHTVAGMIALFTPDGQLNGGNQQLLDYFQLPLEEVANWATNGITHPDDLQYCIDTFSRSVETGEPYDYETRFRRHDGVYRWFQIRGHPLRDEDGSIIRWYGLLTDIDDRKRTEDELRRSETFLMTGQRISQTGTFSWMVDSDKLTFSDELLRIFEFDDEDVITFEKVLERIHPDDLALQRERIAGVRNGVPSTEYEVRLVTPTGGLKYLRIIGQVIEHKDGRREDLGAVQDVTQRRLAEEASDRLRTELARATGFMSLGQMSASIAHEVNQPLSGVITNASTCLRLLSADPPNIDVALEATRRTIRDGNRAADVIARLRALFSKREIAFEALDLNEAVQEVIALSVSDRQRSRVILRTNFSKVLPMAIGDRVQIQQVIMNLLRNATEAVNAVSDRSREITIKTDSDQDGNVRFSVCDNGIGFG